MQRLRFASLVLVFTSAVLLTANRAFAESGTAPSSDKGVFRLWAMGCSHVDKDMDRGNRESLGEAIRQSEGRNGDGAPAFDWDIAIHRIN